MNNIIMCLICVISYIVMILILISLDFMLCNLSRKRQKLIKEQKLEVLRYAKEQYISDSMDNENLGGMCAYIKQSIQTILCDYESGPSDIIPEFTYKKITKLAYKYNFNPPSGKPSDYWWKRNGSYLSVERIVCFNALIIELSKPTLTQRIIKYFKR